ncbi:MAG: hypothetical protein NW201_13650 [Gemmatimonadales bacterium]|nr:hypothetical protein [Gemmatimonadales bacterium]
MAEPRPIPPLHAGAFAGALVLGAVVLSGFASHRGGRDALRDEIRVQLRTAADFTATQVDEGAIARAGSADTAALRAAVSAARLPLLRRLAGMPQLRRAWTVSWDGRTARMLADLQPGAEVRGGSVAAPGATLAALPPALVETLRDGWAAVDARPVELEPFGAVLTAWAPVRGAEGGVVGAVGLALDAGAYERRLAALEPFEAIGMVVGMLLAIGIGLWVRDCVAARDAHAAAAREHADELARTQRAARIGGWRYELAGARLRWSGELRTLWEVPPGAPDPSLSSLLERLDVLDRVRLEAAMGVALGHGRPWALDVRVEAPTLAGERWFGVTGEPVRDAAGRVIALRGTMQDLTARKQLEHALVAARDALADFALAMELDESQRAQVTALRHTGEFPAGMPPAARAADGPGTAHATP